jgi:hypothetical protein
VVATKHSRPHPLVPRRGPWAGRAAGAGGPHEVGHLLEQVATLSTRAPELVLVLGERASALAETAGSGEFWVRAESLVVSARVRLGLRAATVGRAVAALRAAEDLGDTVLAAGLRTDLAVCARAVGMPLTGIAALRPVLDLAGFSGASKATALCHLVGCLSQFGRKAELDRTLTEADRLCGADEGLDGDGRLLARALLRVGVSSHRRRHGDILGAADAARTGLGFLEQLEDPGSDGGVVQVRLLLQLVCSLLDRGDTRNALEIAQPVLDEPPRAAAVAPMGWLRLAVASRILLPTGAAEAAAEVLRDGVHNTDRHGLHALSAQLWAELAYVEDRLGRPSEAIECLHRGRAAEHVHARARRQAISLLSGEFGNGTQAEVNLDDVLGAAPGTLGGARTAAYGGEPADRPLVIEQFTGTPGAEVSTREPASARSETSSRKSVAARSTGDERLPAAAVAGRSEAGTAEAGTTEAGMAAAGTAAAGPVLVRPERPGGPVVFMRPASPTPAAEVPESGATAEGTGSRPVTAGEQEPLTSAQVSEFRAAWQALAARETRGTGDRGPARKWGMVGGPGLAGEHGARKTGEPGRSRAQRRALESSTPKTRHDVDHGSVTARSVLDRMGISAGPGGGRRRAESGNSREQGKPESSRSEPEDSLRSGPGGTHRSGSDAGSPPRISFTPPGEPALSNQEQPAASGVDETPEASRFSSAAVDSPPQQEPFTDEANETPRVILHEDWLPRLKLPPSLAPFDDFSLDDPPSLKPDSDLGQASGLPDEQSSPAEPGGSPLDDELPPDAGLADLLARALAEHRAGTASAAALVKRLGSGGGDSGESRTVNGHGRHNGHGHNGD